MATWNDDLKKQQERYLDELLDFLRIPSISSLPENKGDVEAAAKWVADRLQTAGLEEVKVLPTAGHPVVYGEWLHAEGKPTITIYGHFDVQPVDPLELWTHPPFEPVVKDGRVYARGASDDKGNMLIPILAVETMLRTLGTLPVNVKMFFEGQEEIGSPDLPDFIAAHRDLLACDMIFSADGGQFDEKQAALIASLRGLCAVQIDIQGAKTDVHSGTYGGTFENPIHAMARIIDSLHNSNGKIAVDGFYDDVRELSADKKAVFSEVPFSESKYMAELGVDQLVGESGYSTYERAWARPTLELNGVWGGFQGEGVKTVIPSLAHAKISCRLVPDQDPDRIIQRITEHVSKFAPAGVTVSVKPMPGSADPYVISQDHPGNLAARNVLKTLYGKEPYIVGMGGTIPVCGLFYKYLKADVVNFAFALNDENVHAPDEFFRIASFEMGQKAYCMVLEELGRLNAG